MKIENCYPDSGSAHLENVKYFLLFFSGAPEDTKPVSLRRDKNEVIDDHDMLKLTPEYKAHVATKLSEMLQK